VRTRNPCGKNNTGDEGGLRSGAAMQEMTFALEHDPPGRPRGGGLGWAPLVKRVNSDHEMHIAAPV
jgi:hypothetical protein